MSETGDRAGFLARIAERQGPPPAAGPHLPPPPPEAVPEVHVAALDGIGPGDIAALLSAFGTEAERVDAVVHRDGPEAAVAAIVEAHDVRTAVASLEPDAQALVPLLERLGVAVGPPDRPAAAAADLGVTSAVAAIASTGSVVVDADLAGGRTTSLLPRVHLCVLDPAVLVAEAADVLRRPLRPLPAHRVLVTGPSRTGDIEQILTLGAHGPVALHVLVA
jgi:L-lactate utilization protein LutC